GRELVAASRREGEHVVLEVVHDVRVLLLVVADDHLLAGRRVEHDAQHARRVVLEHVVAPRELPVGAAVEVQRQRRHGGAPPERRHGQSEAQVERRRSRGGGGEPDLRHELRLHRLVHVLRQRRDRRAGVDDRRRPEPRLRHGDPRAAHRDAAQRDEVEGWLRRVLDEAGGPDVAGVRRVVGVEELGRRRAERDDAAALGVEHGGEAVGEAGDVELRRQRPPSPAEPGDARLVRLEDAFVDVAAAERDAPRGEATCIVVAAEGEAVGGELADGERPVAVVVDVDAAPVAPAPPAARRERERAAQRRVAGERGVGGRRGRVQHRGGALLEAVQARRALRPHEIAPRVERQRHGPRRRAHGHVHQVLVRHDPAAGAEPGAHPRAHRRRLRRRQQPPPRPGAVRHAPHDLRHGEAAAGVGVRDLRHDDAAGAGARRGRGARGQRDQDEQRHQLLPHSG
ncbi:hypothetical protein EE612_032609, partial [Oryza sativa]